MKKIIAIVLSLAMVLAMTVSSFAAMPLPTNTEEQWTEYYTEVYTSDSLEPEMKAQYLAVSLTMIDTSDNSKLNMLVRALNKANDNAEAAGVDTVATNDALSAITEEYGFGDLESILNRDYDKDGYLGDPENGKVYVPTNPEDVEAWTLYYIIVLADATENPLDLVTVIGSIAGDVIDGKITMDTFTTAFPAAAEAIGGGTVNQILWGVESLLSQDLDGDYEIGKPDGVLEVTPEEGDGELEEDETPTDDTGFLNTILGILGSIGDMIFGSGDGDTSGDDPSGDAWGDDTNGDTNADDDNLVSDTGDTTVLSVAAVALVAGAALVLTRKKSEDAE